MFNRHLLRLACLALFAIVPIGPANAGPKDYRFRVDMHQTDQRMYFAAQNDGPFTITAQVAVFSENTDSNAAWPKTVVVRPYSAEPLGSVSRLDRTRPASANAVSNFTWGDMRAVHAPGVRYRLPYEEGSTFNISQAYGDRLTSHADPASQHAVDFALPERTPIVAARDGVIVEMTLHHTRGGLQPELKGKANSIVILHDDGTIADYAHLDSRKAPVKVGDRVRAGTLIGYSGDTGYSTGPHLHFAVSRPELGSDGRVRQVALPVIFHSGIPAVEFAPRRGMQVRAKYPSSTAAASAPGATVPAGTEHAAQVARADGAPSEGARRDAPVAESLAAAEPASTGQNSAPPPSVARAAEPGFAAAREEPRRLPVEVAPAVAPAPPPPPVSASVPEVEAQPAPRAWITEAAIAFLITVLGLLCLVLPRRGGKAFN